MRKYGESKTTRIMMATVPHVTSGLGLRKFQADGFLVTRVYKTVEHLTSDRPDMEPRVSLVGDLWCVLDKKQIAVHRAGSSRDVNV